MTHSFSVVVRCLTLLGVLLSLAPAARAAELPLPMILPLVVPNKNPASTSRLELVFCYCPRGTLFPGREKTVIQPINPFFIGQTEITFEQYQSVMGKDSVTPVLDRLKKIGLPAVIVDDLKPHLDPNLWNGKIGKEPVFGLGIEDAVSFCNEVNSRLHALRQIQAQNKDWIQMIEERSIRLPTSWEWQYACLAVRRPEALPDGPPHFPNHQGKKPVEFGSFSNVSKQRLKDLWRIAKKPGENTDAAWSALSPRAFQERLLELAVASYGDTPDGRNAQLKLLPSVLNEFAQACYGWPERGAAASLDRFGVDSASATQNAWGLQGMLDNVTEWVLWQDPSDQAKRTWEKVLVPGRLAALRSSELLFLAGGSFTMGYMKDDLFGRASWGGPLLVGGNPRPLRYLDEQRGQDSLLATYPGFRVVLTRQLAGDWLAQAQRAWLDEPEDKALLQLERARKTIVSIFPDDDSPQRKRCLAILNYQKVLTRKTRDSSDLQKSIDALSREKVVDENDRIFLDLSSK